MKYTKLKPLIVESLIRSLNEVETLKFNGQDTAFEYRNGTKWGLKHRADPRGKTFSDEELNSYPKSFRKGYKNALYGSLWDRFNDRMTDFLGRLGSSRIREVDEPSDPNLYNRPDNPKHRAPYRGFTYEYGEKVYPPDRKLNTKPKSEIKPSAKSVQGDLGI